MALDKLKLITRSQTPRSFPPRMRPMDTKTQQQLDKHFAELKAGDKSAIERIIAAFNARQVERRGHAGYLVKGWTLVTI